MRAVLYERYGRPDVMRTAEIDRPQPGDNEVLVRMVATSVNRSDWETLTGRPLYGRIGGLTRPRERILGSDLAGVVERVGSSVTGFKTGDEVFGDVLYHGKATFAEYVAVSADAPLAVKPPGVSFEQAATLPQAAVLALQGLQIKGHTRTGQQVLINGAGGGGGIFAIQLAKSYGAEVTGVDSAGKFTAMRLAGADHVVDYREANYTKSGERYDRILDFVGSRSVFANRRALKDDGIYLMVGGAMRRILAAFAAGGLISKFGGRHMGMLMARPSKDALLAVAELVVAGTLEPMIDKVYRLEEVPAAMRRLGDGHSLGKVVIRI